MTDIEISLLKANLEATIKERDWAIKLLKSVVSLPDDCERTCAEYQRVAESGCDLDCMNCVLEYRECCPCWTCNRINDWRNWNIKAPGDI